MSVSVVC